jgi:hypothetical protein
MPPSVPPLELRHGALPDGKFRARHGRKIRSKKYFIFKTLADITIFRDAHPARIVASSCLAPVRPAN